MTDEQDQLREAARILGKLGGARGGRARAEALTPKQRSQQARHAAQVRWAASSTGGVTRKCPICGKPYKFYAHSAADQSACPPCVREAAANR